MKGREEIFKVHAKEGKTLSSAGPQGARFHDSRMVGADIANIVNEAALLAARKGKEPLR